MARIRTIKPEFWTDETVAECSMSARLLFVGTWNVADDHGNLERSAKQLKAQVFPYDAIDCEPLIQELIACGRLIEYEDGGKKYLHIKNFEKHQRIDKKSKARCPLYEDSKRTRVVVDEQQVRKGREGKGKEGKDLSAENPAAKVIHPIWDDGIKAFTEAGVPWDQARSYVGKLLKDYEEGYVADALQESRGTRDPRGYVVKLLAGKPKRAGKSDPLAGVV